MPIYAGALDVQAFEIYAGSPTLRKTIGDTAATAWGENDFLPKGRRSRMHGLFHFPGLQTFKDSLEPHPSAAFLSRLVYPSLGPSGVSCKTSVLILEFDPQT